MGPAKSRNRLALCIRQATLGLMLGASLGASADDGEPPTRAQDPTWGEVLYDYYQGNALDALTRLAVARQQGGIDGHGQHPALVEGGLMLSWGMLREARDRFERLLDESVDVRQRNQAWFYLAKVFYLETDHDSARNALAQLDQTVFRKQQPELYRESLYLQGQIALKDQSTGDAPELAGILDDLPDDSLFAAYLRYNRILVANAGNREQALEALASDLDDDDWQDARQGERQALQDRIRLTLAALRYQSGEHSEVPEILADIDDQSLFGARARRLETLSAEGRRPSRCWPNGPPWKLARHHHSRWPWCGAFSMSGPGAGNRR